MNDYIPTSEFSFELAFVSLYCGGKLGNRCSDLLEHANMQAWTLLEKLSCHFFKGTVSNFFSFLIEKNRYYTHKYMLPYKLPLSKKWCILINVLASNHDRDSTVTVDLSPDSLHTYWQWW